MLEKDEKGLSEGTLAENIVEGNAVSDEKTRVEKGDR